MMISDAVIDSEIRIEDFLYDQLKDPQSQWSIGTFGAVAEFSNVKDENVAITRKNGRLQAVSDRGGISMQLDERCRLFASESIAYQGWSQRVALCMKVHDARMNARSVLTELSNDTNALRLQDRDGILFDLGLAAPHVDFCIRVRDGALLALLREQEGLPLYEAENPALHAILMLSPERVFLSRIGRVEVFQRIPRHNEKSPEGPHTHVLPKLLKQRRTHSATEPMPDGFVPCMHVYPWHPADVSIGRKPRFDVDQHIYFQRVLRAFGASEAIEIKDVVRQYVLREQDPPGEAFAASRVNRANIRIALRQLKASNCASATLPSWIAAFDRVHDSNISASDANPEIRIM